MEELKNLRAQKVKEARELHESTSEWTDDAQARYDGLMVEIDQLAQKIERAEEVAKLEATLPKDEPEERKAGAPVTSMKEPQDDGGQWAHIGEFLRAVKRARMTGRIDPRLLDVRQTGMSEGTNADGGYLVPREQSTQILQAAFDRGDLINKCRVLPMASNIMWIPAVNETEKTTDPDGSGAVGYVARGGVSIYSLEEGAEKPDSKPEFTVIQLQLRKHACVIFTTDELIEDSPVTMASLLDGLVAPTMAEYLDEMILNGGGGDAGQMTGIIDHAATVQVARDTAGEVNVEDLVNLYSRLLPSAARNATWVVNHSVFPGLQTLVLGQMPVYMPGGSLSNTPYGTIFGRPVVVCQSAQALGTAGDVVVGDFQQYIVGRKSSGMSFDTSMHVAFLTDETAFRWVLRIDGRPWMGAPITPLNGGTLSAFAQLDDVSGS